MLQNKRQPFHGHTGIATRARTLLAVTLASALAWLSLGVANAADLSEMPAGKYTLDDTHASVIWKVSHFGFSTYPGRFTDFDVDLEIDPADFTNSKVAVDIKVDSIQTSYPYPEKEDFDKELATGWFKSAEHPSITFTSTKVSELTDGNFSIEGNLTMMGETLPVTMAATLNRAVTKHPFKGTPFIGFSASTTVDRTQFGQTKYAPNIGAEVAIEIEAEFSYSGE